MIDIVFEDGAFVSYKPEDYTDYKYDGKYFIVINDKQWIGFYNMTYVKYIQIEKAVNTEE